MQIIWRWVALAVKQTARQRRRRAGADSEPGAEWHVAAGDGHPLSGPYPTRAEADAARRALDGPLRPQVCRRA